MKRGEIWLGRLNPARGREIGKTRPVLIVQEDALTEAGYATVIVLPLTTQVREHAEPLRVDLPPRGRLRARSQVVTSQPRAIDRQRLVGTALGRVTDQEMLRVERGVLAAIGLHRHLGDR